MRRATTPLPDESLLTVKETAKILKLCTKSVRRMIERGDIPAHRLGRLVRIAPADLHAFLKLRRD